MYFKQPACVAEIGVTTLDEDNDVDRETRVSGSYCMERASDSSFVQMRATGGNIWGKLGTLARMFLSSDRHVR